MKVYALKTNKILPHTVTLFDVLDRYVHHMEERSVLAITSKIVAICEGSVVKMGDVDKLSLIQQEAELYLPPEDNNYGVSLTIKGGMLVASAGIDESNGNGYYILWPRDSQKTVNQVRKYLRERFSIKHAGVIITDSKNTPLRWGTTGFTLAHSGFAALNNYIGEPDIFGRLLHMTQSNVIDELGVIAVAVMGEGREQTPLAIIEDAAFVRFRAHNPTQKEIKALAMDIEGDIYASLLTYPKWKKGGGQA